MEHKMKKSALVEALDKFESALVEFCRTHTTSPSLAIEKGLRLLPEKDRKLVDDEIRRLDRVSKKAVNGTANQSFS
jgi:hypothetical protein